MMFPAQDSGYFRGLIDVEHISEGDRLQVTLADGRILRFLLQRVFDNANDYDRWRRLSAEERQGSNQSERQSAAGFVVDIVACVACGNNRNSDFRRCWCGSITVQKYRVTVTQIGEPITTPWSESVKAEREG